MMATWKILKPIGTTLEMEPDMNPDYGVFLVSDALTERYGVGDSPAEAFDEWFEELTEFYEFLESRISDDYPENEKFLNAIKGYIVRVEDKPETKPAPPTFKRGQPGTLIDDEVEVDWDDEDESEDE